MSSNSNNQLKLSKTENVVLSIEAFIYKNRAFGFINEDSVFRFIQIFFFKFIRYVKFILIYIYCFE